jgi:nucleoside-diphosphate-sugar epimerase
MKRVIVTGATGFIGRHSLQPLIERGYEVHTVGSRPAEHPLSVIRHSVDLLDAGAVDAMCQEIQPTHLLHFAWSVNHGDFWHAPANLDWTAASLRLLRSFHEAGGQRVVFAGSCAEYSWEEGGVLSEERTPMRPLSLYGNAKHALQSLSSAYARQVDISMGWGRIFFIFGPHEDPGRLVPSVALAALREQPVTCSDERKVRDFLHVADVADAFVAFLDGDVRGPVNIASGTGRTLRNVIESILGEVGYSVSPLWGARPNAPNEPRELIAETSRLLNEVRWQPRVLFEDRLRETVDWWRDALVRDVQTP